MLARILLLAFFSPACLTFAQQTQEGMASVFKDAFNGQETRYGVRYDQRELTCAHNLHPFGALLKVTNLDNKRSVTVRVIDEGPFIKGRIIELSRRAGELLGIKTDEETLVRVELVRRPDTQAKTDPPTPANPATAPPPATPEPIPPVQKTAPVVAAKQATDTPKAKLVRNDVQKQGIYHITMRSHDPQSWGVQISSVSNPEYIFEEIAKLQSKNFDNILLSVEEEDTRAASYKLILGPFYSEGQARQYQATLKSRHKINGFVVNLHRPGN
jgi:rare lipoprotein A